MPGSIPAPPSSLAPPLASPPTSVGSRSTPQISLVPSVDFSAMAAHQESCDRVRRLRLLPSLRVAPVPVDGVLLWCDLSTGAPRPLVPEVFRYAVFLALHGIAHPGTRATRRLISARFVWDGMSSDLALWSRQCLQCQRGKVLKHHRPVPEPIPVPVRRFSHIHVDLVGPLPRSGGYSYLFTIIDRTTRWPEAVPLASTTASDCSLRARLASSSWILHLPWVLLGLRSAPREDSSTSAAGAVYGAELCLPGQFLQVPEPPSDEFLAGFQKILAGSSPPPPRHNLGAPAPGSPAVQRALETVDFVFVRQDGPRSSLDPCYAGPYRVVSRSRHHFKLLVGTSEDVISVHRLKPAYLPAGSGPAAPPRRGRPPRVSPSPSRRVTFTLPSGSRR